MGYRRIFVHLDINEAAPGRLSLALTFAKAFQAHLTCLFTALAPDPSYDYPVSECIDYLARRAEHEATLKRLLTAGASISVTSDWKYSSDNAFDAALNEARMADLVIVGQQPPDPDSFVADHFVEKLLLAAGRPVIVVPYAGQFHAVGTSVMVAWDGSRAATRVLHDALPFIVQAKQVTVLSVNTRERESTASDIAAVIARYGANVVTQEIDGTRGVPIGDILLSCATDLRADLLVMGAYGHSRWRELVLGGATHSVLKAMTVPVLMSH